MRFSLNTVFVQITKIQGKSRIKYIYLLMLCASLHNKIYALHSQNKHGYAMNFESAFVTFYIQGRAQDSIQGKSKFTPPFEVNLYISIVFNFIQGSCINVFIPWTVITPSLVVTFLSFFQQFNKLTRKCLLKNKKYLEDSFCILYWQGHFLCCFFSASLRAAVQKTYILSGYVR